MSNITNSLKWLPITHLTTDYNDKFMLKQAYTYAGGSPDPRTKNGAVLVNSEKFIIGYSANRFPRRVQETTERLNNRKIKLQIIVHAEHAAILHAARFGKATTESTLYCPFYACNECSKAIIEAGIVRVVGHAQLMSKASDHTEWVKSIILGWQLMIEAGVECCLYDGYLGLSTRFNGKDIVI